MSQTMLYRPGKSLRVWNRYWVDTIVVPSDEVELYLEDGWFERPGGWEDAEEEQPKRRGRKPKDAAQ